MGIAKMNYAAEPCGRVGFDYSTWRFSLRVGPSRKALACIGLALARLLVVKPAEAQYTAMALRSAVPILCTEDHMAARTRVRGTGVIADSRGLLLTAAHVIQQARSNCALSVMVPDNEWNRFRQLHAFLVTDCNLFLSLDLAVCRTRPADNRRDWGYLRPARIRMRVPLAGEPVSITAFTGWGLSPLVRAGHVQGRNIYQRQDGCYCDLAVDITATGGMSGSPLLSSRNEVIGILTLSGTGKFRGLSFGASLQEAFAFLKREGIPLDSSEFAGATTVPDRAH